MRLQLPRGFALNLREDVPLPRLYLIRWDSRFGDGHREEPDTLLLGIEVKTEYGEPAVELELEIPWRRPRPWPEDSPGWQFPRYRSLAWHRDSLQLYRWMHAKLRQRGWPRAYSARRAASFARTHDRGHCPDCQAGQHRPRQSP
jgi:hypothetical protein